MLIRYHVYLGERRTTVNLDDELASLLSLKLNCEPHTFEAHQAVREWCQAQLDRENDPGLVRVSQWLQRQALHLLVERRLFTRYLDWLDAQAR